MRRSSTPTHRDLSAALTWIESETGWDFAEARLRIFSFGLEKGVDFSSFYPLKGQRSPSSNWNGFFILNQSSGFLRIKNWLESDWAPNELRHLYGQNRIRLGEAADFGQLKVIPYQSDDPLQLSIHNVASRGPHPGDEGDCQVTASLDKVDSDRVRIRIEGRLLEQLSPSEWPFCTSLWEDVQAQFECADRPVTIALAKKLGLVPGQRLQSQSLFAPSLHPFHLPTPSSLRCGSPIATTGSRKAY